MYRSSNVCGISVVCWHEQGLLCNHFVGTVCKMYRVRPSQQGSWRNPVSTNYRYSKPARVVKSGTLLKRLSRWTAVCVKGRCDNYSCGFAPLSCPISWCTRNRRGLAVKLSFEGWTYETISSILGCTAGFVSQSKQAYTSEGVVGLLLKYTGSQPLLSQEQRDDVITWLKQQQQWSPELFASR